MCIRDSPRARQRHCDADAGVDIDDVAAASGVEAAAAGRSVCLLYTSDAADERSSVDLGGRRIIKKKKNKRREG